MLVSVSGWSGPNLAFLSLRTSSCRERANWCLPTWSHAKAKLPMTMNNFALACDQVGKHQLALSLHEEVLKLRKARLGPDHPDTLTSMHNLAGAYRVANKLDEALLLYAETLKRRTAKLGADHPTTLTSMDSL